jgi:hypothetical protein
MLCWTPTIEVMPLTAASYPEIRGGMPDTPTWRTSLEPILWDYCKCQSARPGDMASSGDWPSSGKGARPRYGLTSRRFSRMLTMAGNPMPSSREQDAPPNSARCEGRSFP